VVGRAVNLAFRLVDSEVLRDTLAESSADLAVITSSWFYEEVVWHSEVAGYYSVIAKVGEYVLEERDMLADRRARGRPDSQREGEFRW
jgi:hypothetical protein